MSKHAKQEAPASPFFVALARFVLRHRWLCLVATLAVTGFAGYQASNHLIVDTRTESLIVDDSEASLALKELRKEFGDDNLYFILVEGDVFSMPYLERLKALHERLAALDIDMGSPDSKAGTSDSAEGGGETGNTDLFSDFGQDTGWGSESSGSVIDEITSLINVRLIGADDANVTVGGLLDQWPSPDELPALKQRVLADPNYVGNVVGAAGSHSVIVLRTQLMSEENSYKVYNEIRTIVGEQSQEGFRIQIAGWPAVNSALNEMLLADLQVLIGLAHLVLLLFLAVSFRHPLGIIGPIMVVLQSTMWTFGAMAVTGVPMTTLSNIMPVLLICVGIGDSIHIQSVYRQIRQQGGANDEAIIQAIGKTGLALLLTSVTTAVAMASFKFASLGAVQELGLFCAFGVMAALVHSVVFLPIILSFNKKSLLGAKKEKTARDWIDVIISFCNGLSASSTKGRRRARLVVAVGVGLGLAMSAGIASIRVAQNALTWFPSGHDVPHAFETMDRHVGGSSNVVILVEASGEQGIKDQELLFALERLEQHILAYRQAGTGEIVVTKVSSILDVVRETWRALNGSSQQHYAIPDSGQGVVDAFTVLENADAEHFKRVVTLDATKAAMLIRVKWMDAGEYAPMARHIKEGIDELIDDKARVRTTGAVYTSLAVFDAVVTDLVRSFGSAFAVIAVIMILLVRSLKLGLLSLLPNLLPVGMVLGIMGLGGIPLDLNTLLVGSIAIGIIVDDTIHFMHQFRSHYMVSGDVDAAVNHAFSHAGRALVNTSVILAAGFSVYIAAAMYNVQLLGILVGLTVLFALATNMILAPALLRAFVKNR